MSPIVTTTAVVALAGSQLGREFITRVFGPLASEAGDLIADPLRDRRQRRLGQIADRAAEILAERGAEASELADDVSIPFLEAATLTDDETLQEQWAQLLATYSTEPATPKALLSVLKELSPLEARFLNSAASALRALGMLGSDKTKTISGAALKPEGLLAAEQPSEAEIELLKENLLRLRVLETGSVGSGGAISFGDDPNTRIARADTGVVCLTALGTALIEAVSPAA